MLCMAALAYQTYTEIDDNEVNLSRASPQSYFEALYSHYASWHCAGLLVELGIEEKVRLARR